MAGSHFIPRSNMNDTLRLNWEKQLLIKNYNFLEVKLIGNVLHCKGVCNPSEHSIDYKYKVVYTPSQSPSVYSVEPKIAYNGKIHMYPQDSSLCLHYPKDFSWTSTSHLYDTIIPWTHEWFLFYELFKIRGKWLHPEVLHKGEKSIR
jgi:hypothetical protein